jgi:hypothetical protein
MYKLCIFSRTIELVGEMLWRQEVTKFYHTAEQVNLHVACKDLSEQSSILQF